MSQNRTESDEEILQAAGISQHQPVPARAWTHNDFEGDGDSNNDDDLLQLLHQSSRDQDQPLPNQSDEVFAVAVPALASNTDPSQSNSQESQGERSPRGLKRQGGDTVQDETAAKSVRQSLVSAVNLLPRAPAAVFGSCGHLSPPINYYYYLLFILYFIICKYVNNLILLYFYYYSYYIILKYCFDFERYV